MIVETWEMDKINRVPLIHWMANWTEVCDKLTIRLTIGWTDCQFANGIAF